MLEKLIFKLLIVIIVNAFIPGLGNLWLLARSPSNIVCFILCFWVWTGQHDNIIHAWSLVMDLKAAYDLFGPGSDYNMVLLEKKLQNSIPISDQTDSTYQHSNYKTENFQKKLDQLNKVRNSDFTQESTNSTETLETAEIAEIANNEKTNSLSDEEFVVPSDWKKQIGGYGVWNNQNDPFLSSKKSRVPNKYLLSNSNNTNKSDKNQPPRNESLTTKPEKPEANNEILEINKNQNIEICPKNINSLESVNKLEQKPSHILNLFNNVTTEFEEKKVTESSNNTLDLPTNLNFQNFGENFGSNFGADFLEQKTNLNETNSENNLPEECPYCNRKRDTYFSFCLGCGKNLNEILSKNSS